MDKQMMIHHITGGQVMIMSYWKQDFVVNVGVAMIFLEISNPFVNLRWLLFRHGYLGNSLI